MTTPPNKKDSSTTSTWEEHRGESVTIDPSRPLKFTVIDPGQFIGWARFLNEMPQTVGVLEYKDSFFDWLSEEQPDLFVMENYFIRPAHMQRGYQHQWNKGEALQVIGAVKYHARRHGIPVELQQSSIQSTESKRTGIPYKKGKSNDINSAVLHGTHWWFKTHGPTNENKKGGRRTPSSR